MNLSIEILSFPRKRESGQKTRHMPKIPACAEMTRFSVHVLSRFAARHRDPDMAAAKLAGMTTGFSLIELSIVLVILGLLTGGILTGQNLIRAAELRSVTTEYQAYQTAVNTFRDKYFALPGDMRNATAFWGNADTGTIGGECSDNSADVGTGTQTCNGNGDGILASLDSGATYPEHYRFWQHLANAGLIAGTYTGVDGPEAIRWDDVAGENVPRAKLSGALWSSTYDGIKTAADTNHFEGEYGNNLRIYSESGGALLPEEAWNIDSKIDDGKPGLGNVRTFKVNTNCNTTTIASTAEYHLTFSDKACALIFTGGY